MKRFYMGLIAGAACLSALGAPVTIVGSKPADGGLAQSDPDDTSLGRFGNECMG